MLCKSVLQYWPTLKLVGVRDSLCRLVKTKMNMIQLSEKLKKYFVFPTGSMSCKSRCHHYFHTLLTLLTNCVLVPYPINTIRIFHLTLLTNCILAAIFPSKEELASWLEFAQSNNICRNYANQPSPGYTLSLTQWLNMPIPCRHIMTHNLSKRGCKCVALRRPKLGKLRWCYRNLSMRGLAKFKKIINFFIDRTIFNEPWNLRAIRHRT